MLRPPVSVFFNQRKHRSRWFSTSQYCQEADAWSLFDARAVQLHVFGDEDGELVRPGDEVGLGPWDGDHFVVGWPQGILQTTCHDACPTQSPSARAHPEGGFFPHPCGKWGEPSLATSRLICQKSVGIIPKKSGWRKKTWHHFLSKENISSIQNGHKFRAKFRAHSSCRLKALSPASLLRNDLLQKHLSEANQTKNKSEIGGLATLRRFKFPVASPVRFSNCIHCSFTIFTAIGTLPHCSLRSSKVSFSAMLPGTSNPGISISLMLVCLMSEIGGNRRMRDDESFDDSFHWHDQTLPLFVGILEVRGACSFVVLTIIYPHYPIINHHDQQNRWSMMVISDGKKSEALTQSQLSRVQPKRRMTSWQLTANARGLW